MNDEKNKVLDQTSKSRNPASKSEVTKAPQRRPAQLALTQVPIDIAAFGTTFFLVNIFYRDEANSTDYVQARAG